MNIFTITSTIKLLKEQIIDKGTIANTIANYENTVIAYRTNPPAHVTAFLESINNAKAQLAFMTVLSKDEKALLKLYDIDNFAENVFWTQTIANIKANSPDLMKNMDAFIGGLKYLKTKIEALSTFVYPLNKLEKNITDQEAIFEVVFDNNVQISNISEGKEQINNWWIIIDGYAHLFGVRREDFEILTISKNTPTKMQIKSTIVIVAGILTIAEKLLNIEKAFLPNKVLIEQLKTNPLIDDQSANQIYIEQSEAKLNKTIDRHIDEVIEERMKAHKNTAKKENLSSIKKSIETQYNFTINGGDVRFYINDPKYKEEIRQVEQTKLEIKRVKDSLTDIKLLSNKDNNTDTKDKSLPQ